MDIIGSVHLEQSHVFVILFSLILRDLDKSESLSGMSFMCLIFILCSYIVWVVVSTMTLVKGILMIPVRSMTMGGLLKVILSWYWV